MEKIDLLQPYTRLACYRCKAMRVSECGRYAWCVLGHKDFPIMCELYHG